ncbi:MAG: SIR2 family protein [Carnobacterium sp.]|nr:SIR2 family protein [Carnobacterium sp.]
MDNYDSYLESNLEQLKQYIASMESRPILFIGSGFSQRYINAPTWSGLLEQLINENPDIKRPLNYFIQQYNNDYAKIASELVKYYREYAWDNPSETTEFPEFTFNSDSTSIHLKYKISSILIELLEKFDPDTHELSKEIKLFEQLNPQAIITTNYDNLLETLFPKYVPIVGQEIIYQKTTTNIARILKIHGSVDACDSIVIEQKDYDNFSNNQIYLTAKLFTYFVEHPIIFIGYSLNDENIKAILHNVKQIINPENEPKIENMWFIDWSKEPINSDEIPPSDKSISVGNGGSVRINYIKLHTYEKLYEALYQDSVDMDILKKIEETMYNVVKSDTITNLEVDIASLHYLTERESLLNAFTHSRTQDNQSGTPQYLTFAEINDPNQLASQFPFTPTQLSEEVFDSPRSHWYLAYSLINDVFENTGVDLRATNNIYFVSLNKISRYSREMVNLLKLVKDSKPYTINIDNENISSR